MSSSTATPTARICPCGSPFPPDRAPQARYHSDACASAHRQQRKRAKDAPTPAPDGPYNRAAAVEYVRARASLEQEARAEAMRWGWVASCLRRAGSPTPRQLADYTTPAPPGEVHSQTFRYTDGAHARIPRRELREYLIDCGDPGEFEALRSKAGA